MNTERYSDKRLYGFFYYYWNRRPVKSNFELGISVVSDRVQRLAKEASYEDLNTVEGADIEIFRESGLMLHLGLWQFRLGIRLKVN